MNWLSGLPGPHRLEKLHDLGKTRILVFYPVLPQNPHKFALVSLLEDLPQVPQ
jgi:hypothetical protein